MYGVGPRSHCVLSVCSSFIHECMRAWYCVSSFWPRGRSSLPGGAPQTNSSSSADPATVPHPERPLLGTARLCTCILLFLQCIFFPSASKSRPGWGKQSLWDRIYAYFYFVLTYILQCLSKSHRVLFRLVSLEIFSFWLHIWGVYIDA